MVNNNLYNLYKDKEIININHRLNLTRETNECALETSTNLFFFLTFFFLFEIDFELEDHFLHRSVCVRPGAG